MKSKVIDGSAIVIAGVVSYGSMSTERKPKKKRVNIDFDLDLDINKEDLDRIKKDIKESARIAKEAFKTKKNAKEYNLNDFEESMKEFGKNMEQWGNEFGKSMSNIGDKFAEWGKSFEVKMENQMKGFEQHFDDFEKDVEDDIEVKFEKSMESHWKNNCNAEDYNVWELIALFKDVYMHNPGISEIDVNPDVYYEVQSYDLPISQRDQMTLVGCQVNSINDVPHPLVTQKLKADHWLILKLTNEEYNSDWLQEAKNLDLVKEYDIKNYFIVRHFKDSTLEEEKKIKVYIPLELNV